MTGIAVTKTTPSARDRARFQTSIETRLIYGRLRDLAVGETASYAELSALIGQEVRGVGRNALRMGRQMALRDDRIITDAVPGVGIKRLSDSEAVQSSAGYHARVRRMTRRAVQRLTAVDYDALVPQDKSLHNAHLSAFAVVKLMATPKSLDRIIAANTSATGELPIARTIELFRGPKPQ